MCRAEPVKASFSDAEVKRYKAKSEKLAVSVCVCVVCVRERCMALIVRDVR